MKAVRRGFIKSIPILCSYLFVGMAYGITMQNAGFIVALSYKWKHNTFAPFRGDTDRMQYEQAG
ncbi:MAG TPA: hypothetical protein DCX57_03545 [Lachnospiraceae bacterium]|nr:hypothetical protein [Lachnospiraceae bacterium]